MKKCELNLSKPRKTSDMYYYKTHLNYTIATMPPIRYTNYSKNILQYRV